MFIVAAILFLPFLAAALAVTLLVARVTRTLSPNMQTLILVLTSCLLVTPTLGPATIAVVPVTFGWLLIPTIADWSWADLVDWVALYPRWHAFAFPATALITYLVVRRVRPNNSFKPKPLRGSA